MQTWYIPIIVFSAIILFALLKRFFAKGKIIDIYFYPKEKPFILLLLDYQTSSMTKSGIYLRHSYRLRKLDINNLKTVYETKISNFSSGMLDGYVKIFGLNKKYTFISTYNKDIIAISSESGKILCNKKTIEKQNPQLKKFNPHLTVYSYVLQSIIIYDNQGYGYLLDPEKITTQKIDFQLSEKDNAKVFYNFSDLASVKIDKDFLTTDNLTFFNAGSGKYDINLISDKGSKRYFLHIKTNFSSEKPQKLENSFLNPKIMGTGTSLNQFISKKPPSVLIAHSENLNPKIKNINISLVKKGSIKIWEKNITEIVEKPYFSSYNNLYYLIIDKKILFIFAKESSNKISFSKVEKSSGAVLLKPMSYKFLNFKN